MRYREQIAKQAKAAIAATAASHRANSAPYHVRDSAEQDASLALAQMATGSANAAKSQLIEHIADQFQQNIPTLTANTMSAEQRAMLLKLHSNLGDMLAGASSTDSTEPVAVGTSISTPAVVTPSASTSAANLDLSGSSDLKSSPIDTPADATTEVKIAHAAETPQLSTNQAQNDSAPSTSNHPTTPPKATTGRFASLLSAANDVSDIRSDGGFDAPRGAARSSARDGPAPRSSSAPGSPRTSRRATRMSSKLRH